MKDNLVNLANEMQSELVRIMDQHHLVDPMEREVYSKTYGILERLKGLSTH